LGGRIKGGRNSVLAQNNKNSGFKVRKRFPKPRESTKLAEFIGIMLGDGSLTESQVRIILSSKDDRIYARYVKHLMYELFSEPPSVTERSGNILEIVISGKNLVNYLKQKGLVVGNKIRQGVCIPNWIFRRISWRRAVLKGLLDTDGCVYLDRHKRNNVGYRSICIAYTTYSKHLFNDIYNCLVFLGFSPTKSTKNRVMLRRRKEIKQFFRYIGSENAKHQLRYKNYLEE
jgi:intein/homing endonuclease